MLFVASPMSGLARQNNGGLRTKLNMQFSGYGPAFVRPLGWAAGALRPQRISNNTRCTWALASLYVNYASGATLAHGAPFQTSGLSAGVAQLLKLALFAAWQSHDFFIILTLNASSSLAGDVSQPSPASSSFLVHAVGVLDPATSV